MQSEGTFCLHARDVCTIAEGEGFHSGGAAQWREPF